MPIEFVRDNLDIEQKAPLKDSLYEAFKKSIILGEIPVGHRINEQEFSQQLNISRTPIRHAMQMLQEDNLVQHVPRSGNIVIGLSVQDVYEIFDVRNSLDTLATLRAMEKMTDEDYKELKLLLEEAEVLNETGDVEGLIQNFMDHSDFIYTKSEMFRTRKIVRELRNYYRYFQSITFVDKGIRTQSIKEHWVLYEAMRSGDINKINHLMTDHINDTLESVIELMKLRDNDLQ